jgi:hypothetical protein
MYNLKNVMRRASALAGVVSFTAALGIMLVPPGITNADALNPLTDRSLTLSSSSPGWSYTDGSDNGTYATPNTGANGKKTGETFSFNVSTNSSNIGGGSNQPIKGLTFQYCTGAAGPCTGPGNDGWNDTADPTTPTYVDNPDTTSTTNLNVTTSSPTELSSGNASSLINLTSAAVGGTQPGNVYQIPANDNSQGNFVVLTKDVGASSWSYNSGWAMSASANDDTNTVTNQDATSDNNFITLADTSGGFGLQTGGSVKVIFFATNTNYITNPGAGAFFVKINDYRDTTLTNLIDGGVTVANVMNQSIAIQTKVLETMDFSVGTVDPDTLTDAQYQTALGAGSAVTHGQCDPILTSLNPSTDAANTLILGNPTQEDSLSTTHTYGTHSFFRLSSNSSAGANVYYSGETLSNTEGDQIAAMGTTALAPHLGTPQFGLALDNDTNAADTGTYDSSGTTEGVNYATDATYEQAADHSTGVDASFGTDTTGIGDTHNPRLYPLTPATAYADGTGAIDGGSVDTDFAFDANANTVPALIASESNQVVDCITGKVRYIGDIAATTPAGIFTTKINYIAAPQY